MREPWFGIIVLIGNTRKFAKEHDILVARYWLCVRAVRALNIKKIAFYSEYTNWLCFICLFTRTLRFFFVWLFRFVIGMKARHTIKIPS